MAALLQQSMHGRQQGAAVLSERDGTLLALKHSLVEFDFQIGDGLADAGLCAPECAGGGGKRTVPAHGCENFELFEGIHDGAYINLPITFYDGIQLCQLALVNYNSLVFIMNHLIKGKNHGMDLFNQRRFA